nr:hypothetical protein [Tanacetum cinerariifolium]
MTTVTTVTSTVDPTLVSKEKLVEPSPFGAGSSSAGETDHITDVFSNLTGSDFLVGAIYTVINPDTNLQKLFTEFNVGPAHQMSLSAEVRMCAEYNVKEKRRLKSVVESHGELLTAREEEIESLKARLLLKEAEAAKTIRLRIEASNFKTMEKSLRDETNVLRERNFILKKERNALDVKVTELETSPMSKEREIRENLDNQRSALRDVFVPLAEPFFDSVLTGTEGASDTAVATADITMTLSTAFAFASTIVPISIDDYEVMGADDCEIS